MSNRAGAKDILIGAAGAIAGGVLGWFAARWVVQSGYYGVFLVGFGMGAGARLLLKRRSLAFGYACGSVAFVASVLCHWSVAPFVTDEGLRYFLMNLHNVGLWSWIDIGFGTFLAFRLPTAFRGEDCLESALSGPPDSRL
jgi:hypothetical protein